MRALLALIAAAAAAQDLSPLRGNYFFVELSMAPKNVRNGGGAIAFDGQGGVKFRVRSGANQGAAADLMGDGRYSPQPSTGAWTLPNPLRPGAVLEARLGNGILIASGLADQANELLVAVPAPDKPIAASALQGIYNAAYLLVKDGDGKGLVTALAELTSDGAGMFPKTWLAGHAAWIDDMNRVEQKSGSKYQLRPDGSGTATFAAPSDAIQGERSIFLSGDGQFLLGFSTAAGMRDILVGLRKDPDAGFSSVRGQYWVVEAGAETDYVFKPSAARFSSGWGSMRSDGNGAVHISEATRSGSQRTHLTTINRYFLGTDGKRMLGPAVKPSVHNLGVGPNFNAILGAHVGAERELTLEHGIFVGIQQSAPARYAVVNAATKAPGPIAPGLLAHLLGAGFTESSRVTVNGRPVRVLKAGPDRLQLLFPADLTAGPASLMVDGNSIPVQAASTSRGLFSVILHSDCAPVTSARPAVSGETVLFFATGCGTPPSLLIGGAPAAINSIAPVPEFPGVHQIRATVPGHVSPGDGAPVVLRTPDAVTDLLEIPVRAH